MIVPGELPVISSVLESQPNNHLCSIICSTVIGDTLEGDADTAPLPRSELDSHANMIVLGSHSFVFDKVQDQTCDVMPFDPGLGTARQIPIVDGAVAYDCPIQNKTFILMFKNALFVKIILPL